MRRATNNPSPTRKAIVSWSGGKDSCWALETIRHDPTIDVVGLVTTINTEFDRVAMHGFRRELLLQQADRLGLRLWPVMLPWPCSNEIYEARMREFITTAQAEGVTACVFGDLFLQDVRSYREKMLSGTSIEPLFPIWLMETRELAAQMIASGVKARLACVDPSKIDSSFAGRDFDHSLLADLPASADPCGENGEFHTFVYDCPMFSSPIPIRSGEVVTRDGFVYADLLAEKHTDVAAL